MAWFVVCGLWFVVCGLRFVVCGWWFVRPALCLQALLSAYPPEVVAAVADAIATKKDTFSMGGGAEAMEEDDAA